MKRILLYIAIITLIVPIFNADSTLVQRTIDENVAPYWWGPILYKSMSLDYSEYILNGDEWGIDYRFSYYIIGLGHHCIHWEYDWDVYAENYTKHYNGSYGGTEEIWTFRFMRRPMIKLRALRGHTHMFDLYDNGTVSARLYIDNSLVWNQTLSYDYWNNSLPYYFIGQWLSPPFVPKSLSVNMG